MGKYIPGNPTVIVQNIAGAGSLKVATNYIYGVAKPDGLTLGVPGSGIYLDQMLGRKEAMFDVAKFAWIGSVDQRDLVLYMKAGRAVEVRRRYPRPPRKRPIMRRHREFRPDYNPDEYLLGRHPRRQVPRSARAIPAASSRSIHERPRDKVKFIAAAQELPPTSLRAEPYFTWHKTGFDRHIVQYRHEERPAHRRCADPHRTHGEKENSGAATQRRQSSIGVGNRRTADDDDPGHALPIGVKALARSFT